MKKDRKQTVVLGKKDLIYTIKEKGIERRNIKLIRKRRIRGQWKIGKRLAEETPNS